MLNEELDVQVAGVIEVDLLGLSLGLGQEVLIHADKPHALSHQFAYSPGEPGLSGPGSPGDANQDWRGVCIRCR